MTTTIHRASPNTLRKIVIGAVRQHVRASKLHAVDAVTEALELLPIGTFADEKKECHRATLETRNFSFEAFGASEVEALAVLRAAFEKHAKGYRLAPTWWEEFADGIECRPAVIGAAYRNGEQI